MRVQGYPGGTLSSGLAVCVMLLSLSSAYAHMPCLLVHLQEDAGLVGYRFNTIGVSDGISMGTDGMSYSLQSR